MAAEQKPPHFVKEWRLYRGIEPQEALADLVGIGRPAITKIENGTGRLMDYRLEAFAKHLTDGDIPSLFMPPPENGDVQKELRIVLGKIEQEGLTGALLEIAKTLLGSQKQKRAA